MTDNQKTGIVEAGYLQLALHLRKLRYVFLHREPANIAENEITIVILPASLLWMEENRIHSSRHQVARSGGRVFQSLAELRIRREEEVSV